MHLCVLAETEPIRFDTDSDSKPLAKGGRPSMRDGNHKAGGQFVGRPVQDVPTSSFRDFANAVACSWHVRHDRGTKLESLASNQVSLFCCGWGLGSVRVRIPSLRMALPDLQVTFKGTGNPSLLFKQRNMVTEGWLVFFCVPGLLARNERRFSPASIHFVVIGIEAAVRLQILSPGRNVGRGSGGVVSATGWRPAVPQLPSGFCLFFPFSGEGFPFKLNQHHWASKMRFLRLSDVFSRFSGGGVLGFPV